MDTQWNTIDTVGGYFDAGFLMDIYGIIDDFSRSEDIKENTISMFCSLKYNWYGSIHDSMKLIFFILKA